MLNATLFKDLEGIGFGALKDQSKGWIKVSNELIQHNVNEVRSVLDQWADTQIKEGTVEDYKREGRNVPRKNVLKIVIC
jgi:hypothetical protein